MPWVPAKIISNDSTSSNSYTFPFQVAIKSSTQGSGNQAQTDYQFAVAYHSSIILNQFGGGDTNLTFTNLPITGLDEWISCGDPSEQGNIYIVVNIEVNNLTAISASIDYIASETDDGFEPFTLDGNNGQIKAQVIIAVIATDEFKNPGSDAATAASVYLHQKVFTDLIITNLVINNTPLIAAVPFIGAPLIF